jgi:dCTP diphosphatase
LKKDHEIKDGERTVDRLGALQDAVRAFNEAREWRQFHSPKNLAMALMIEAAELAEPFRWDDDERSWQRARSDDGRAALSKEMADVLLLLLSLAEYNGIDLVGAARDKLALNEQRYPAERARGRADKYTAYQRESDADE